MGISSTSNLMEDQYYLCGGTTLVYIVSILRSSTTVEPVVRAKAWSTIRNFVRLGGVYTYNMVGPKQWVHDNHPVPISRDKAKMLIAIWGVQ